jgi:hypothetical protein
MRDLLLLFRKQAEAKEVKDLLEIVQGLVRRAQQKDALKIQEVTLRIDDPSLPADLVSVKSLVSGAERCGFHYPFFFPPASFLIFFFPSCCPPTNFSLQVLYCALVWFEEELERQAGRKSYVGGSIGFGTDESRATWTDEQVRRVEALSSHDGRGGGEKNLLRRVADIRNHVFHNDAAVRPDLAQAFADMEELLRRMWGFRTGGEAKKAADPLPLEWQRIKALDESLKEPQGSGSELVLHALSSSSNSQGRVVLR